MFPFKMPKKPHPPKEEENNPKNKHENCKDEEHVQLTWNNRNKGVIMQYTLHDSTVDILVSPGLVMKMWAMVVKHQPPKTKEDVEQVIDFLMGVLASSVPTLQVEKMSMEMVNDPQTQSMMQAFMKAMKPPKENEN